MEQVDVITQNNIFMAKVHDIQYANPGKKINRNLLLVVQAKSALLVGVF